MLISTPSKLKTFVNFVAKQLVKSPHYALRYPTPGMNPPAETAKPSQDGSGGPQSAFSGLCSLAWGFSPRRQGGKPKSLGRTPLAYEKALPRSCKTRTLVL